jgi:cytochrome c oxidase subunit 2
MTLNARGYKLMLLSVVLILGAVTGSAWVAAQPKEPVIRVSAKKFTFTPDTITLKKGVPVILEFKTEDVLMGFNVPDLKLRADIVPGQTTRVRIVPGQVGKFTFFCDIFCGTGHEEMTGMIIVEE